jgi:hypothetical protein
MWLVLPALVLIVSAARGDVTPPVHDETCTAVDRSRFPGQCIECCMGDGCPSPMVRCPAEERFRHQICVRHPNPPETRLTYGVWCDPDLKSSGVHWLIGLARAPAVWLGLAVAAMAVGLTALRLRKRSS